MSRAEDLPALADTQMLQIKQMYMCSSSAAEKKLQLTLFVRFSSGTCKQEQVQLVFAQTTAGTTLQQSVSDGKTEKVVRSGSLQ